MSPDQQVAVSETIEPKTDNVKGQFIFVQP